MPILKAFTMCSHKGGTGKTTTSFQTSCAIAANSPSEKVLLVDLSFQVDVSGTVLSQAPFRGRGAVDGAAVAADYASLQGRTPTVDICIPPEQQMQGAQALPPNPVPKTMGGYFLARNELMNGSPVRRPSGGEFVVHVSEHNYNAPGNLHLVVGDTMLEHLMTPLEQRRAAHGAMGNPWRNVTVMLKEMIDEITMQGNWYVIIDTDPSFNLYTQMAVTAAPHLILLLTPDDYSRAAMNAAFELVFGVQSANHLYDSYIQHYSYHARATACDMQLPKIHLLLGNRLTQYDRTTAKSFDEICTKAEKELHAMYQAHPNAFTYDAEVAGSTRFAVFANAHVHRLHDLHKVSFASAHTGRPVGNIGSTFSIEPQGKKIKLDKDQTRQYNDQIIELVAKMKAGSFVAPAAPDAPALLPPPEL